MKTTQIDSDVLDVLGNSITEGPAFKLVGQLDRPLYLRTNKVLEALGGKWNRKAGAHIFDGDAADIMEQTILTGSYVRAKEDYGAFMTPQPLADMITSMANIIPGMAVLEPSAGTGNLVRAAIAAGGDVTANEIQPAMAEALRRNFPKCTVGNLDFMLKRPNPIFDRVVMNPPFAGRADIHHITHAAQFVRPGGKLVAIASASVHFRSDALATNFRAAVAKFSGTIDFLPQGSFKESGTMVNTAVVTINFCRGNP